MHFSVGSLVDITIKIEYIYWELILVKNRIGKGDGLPSLVSLANIHAVSFPTLTCVTALLEVMLGPTSLTGRLGDAVGRDRLKVSCTYSNLGCQCFRELPPTVTAIIVLYYCHYLIIIT